MGKKKTTLIMICAAAFALLAVACANMKASVTATAPAIEEAQTASSEPLELAATDELEDLNVSDIKVLASEELTFDGEDISADFEAIEVETDSGRVIVAEISEADPEQVVADAALRSAALAHELQEATVDGEEVTEVTWTVANADKTIIVAVTNDPETAPSEGSVKDVIEAATSYDMTDKAHEAISDLGIEKSKGETPTNAQGEPIVVGETKVEDVIHEDDSSNNTLSENAPEPSADTGDTTSSNAGSAVIPVSQDTSKKVESKSKAETPAANNSKPQTSSNSNNKSESNASQSKSENTSSQPKSESKPSGHWENKPVQRTRTIPATYKTESYQEWVSSSKEESWVRCTYCGYECPREGPLEEDHFWECAWEHGACMSTFSKFIDTSHYETRTRQVVDVPEHTETYTDYEKVWVED